MAIFFTTFVYLIILLVSAATGTAAALSDVQSFNYMVSAQHSS